MSPLIPPRNIRPSFAPSETDVRFRRQVTMPVEWYEAAVDAVAEDHPDRLRVRFLLEATYDRYDERDRLQPRIRRWKTEFEILLWPGEVLLSQAELASELGIHPTTIRRRLDTLASREGWEVFALYYSSLRVKHARKPPQHRDWRRDTLARYPMESVRDTNRLRDKPVGTLVIISNYGVLTSNAPNKDRLAGLEQPGYTDPRECGIKARCIPTSGGSSTSLD